MLDLGAWHNGRGQEHPGKDLNFMFPTKGLIIWGASQFGGRTPFLASSPTGKIPGQDTALPLTAPTAAGDLGTLPTHLSPPCPDALKMQAPSAKGPWVQKIQVHFQGLRLPVY